MRRARRLLPALSGDDRRGAGRDARPAPGRGGPPARGRARRRCCYVVELVLRSSPTCRTSSSSGGRRCSSTSGRWPSRSSSTCVWPPILAVGMLALRPAPRCWRRARGHRRARPCSRGCCARRSPTPPGSTTAPTPGPWPARRRRAGVRLAARAARPRPPAAPPGARRGGRRRRCGLLARDAATLGDLDERLYRGGFLVVASSPPCCRGGGPPGAAARAARFGVAPLVWIGLRSYGIYLWHWPVLMLTRPRGRAPGRRPARRSLRRSPDVLLAVLSYRYVEVPFRRHGIAGVRARLGRGRRPVRLAAASPRRWRWPSRRWRSRWPWCPGTPCRPGSRPWRRPRSTPRRGRRAPPGRTARRRPSGIGGALRRPSPRARWSPWATR